MNPFSQVLYTSLGTGVHQKLSQLTISLDSLLTLLYSKMYQIFHSNSFMDFFMWNCTKAVKEKQRIALFWKFFLKKYSSLTGEPINVEKYPAQCTLLESLKIQLSNAVRYSFLCLLTNSWRHTSRKLLLVSTVTLLRSVQRTRKRTTTDFLMHISRSRSSQITKFTTPIPTVQYKAADSSEV